MSEFIKVAALSDIPLPGKLLVEADDRLVVVFRTADGVFCLDDVCTHDGGPLGEGQLEGNCIICPRHGAKFDVRDGRALTMPATKATSSHEVRIDREDIFVRINDNDS